MVLHSQIESENCQCESEQTVSLNERKSTKVFLFFFHFSLFTLGLSCTTPESREYDGGKKNETAFFSQLSELCSLLSTQMTV